MVAFRLAQGVALIMCSVGDITVGQARTALDDLAEGAGGELRPERAAHSRSAPRNPPPLWRSSPLRASLVGRIPTANPGLRIADPRFERTYRVRGVRSQGVPTPDVSILDKQRAVIVESKLLEPWRSEPKVSFSRQYDAVAKRISAGTLGGNGCAAVCSPELSSA